MTTHYSVTEGANPADEITIVGPYDFATRTGRLNVALSVAGKGVKNFPEILEPDLIYISGFEDLGKHTWVPVVRAGLQSNYLYRTAGNQPEYVLGQLLDADSMRLDGPARINDVPTSHYTGYVTLAGLQRHAAKKLVNQLNQLESEDGSTFRQVEVWLDSAGRVVRVEFGLVITGTANFHVVTDFTHYGVDASVRRPTKTTKTVTQAGGPVLG